MEPRAFRLSAVNPGKSTVMARFFLIIMLILTLVIVIGLALGAFFL